MLCSLLMVSLLLSPARAYAVEVTDELPVETDEQQGTSGTLGLDLSGQEEQEYQVQDPDKSREITPEMEANGTTGIQSGQEDGTGVRRVSVSDTILYDFDLGSYCYPVGQGFVYSNVIDGMIVQSGVSLSSDEGIVYTLYRESEPVEIPADGTVTEVGSYTVMTGTSGAEEKLFSFQMIGADINTPAGYTLPTGCVAVSMTLDDLDVLTNNRELSFSQEGRYAISYRCVRNNLDYALSFNVDRTAPVISLDGLKDGKARGEVLIQDLEDGAVLEIYRDGEKISSRTTLTQPGEYRVRVSDAAGNASLYSFFILFYLNAGGISFGVVLLLAIVALGIYLYVSRKRVRVR